MSVVAQSVDSREIVIVDDGSTDKTLKKAVTYANKFKNVEITVIRTRNRGLSCARNLGISAARGEFILPLDADDWIEPHTLEKMREVLAGDCEAVAVAASMVRFGRNDGRVWSPPPYSREIETERNVIPYCSMFRRASWSEVGGYRAEMFGYEDWEFWISLGEVGSIRQIPDVLLHYNSSDSGLLAASVKHDLELRARIIRLHPKIYGSECKGIAERIVDGKGIDPGELLNAPHKILSNSRIAWLYSRSLVLQPEIL